MKDEYKLIADVAFSEAGKNENYDDDVAAIATVILNRVANPDRFGATVEQVVFAPKQFSSIGGKEWQKTQSGEMTPEEERLYKRAVQIVSGVVKGTIKSKAGNADHFYNPELSKPSWGKVYPTLHDSGNHRFLKEVTVTAPKPVTNRKKRISVQKL